MKKLLVRAVLASAALSAFADAFTDAIQDLAMQTACLGQYSATQSGGGWYDDPYDYYTPQMMAQRFAEMSGSMTRTTTFYGVCFDYAQFAWNDVTKYKNWYNTEGMYEAQFWIAGVQDNPNQIELMGIGTASDYTRMQNGVPVKTYSNSLRNVKTHKGLDGSRATVHAWLWIERADGVWFWIDPTWTDNLGYVVYGYVKDGEEVQCRPGKAYCINYPSYLNDLPLPPAMGTRLAPSKTANSTNRNETINDAGSDWVSQSFRKAFIDVDYSGMDNTFAYILSADVPFSSVTGSSISPGRMGFGLEMPMLLSFAPAMTVGVEYLHDLEDGNHLHGGLLTVGFVHRFTNTIAWYLGGGGGLRFDTSNADGYYQPRDTAPVSGAGLAAFKVDTGLILSFSRLFTKIEVSYDNVLGFSVGAGIGIGLDAYF